MKKLLGALLIILTALFGVAGCIDSHDIVKSPA